METRKEITGIRDLTFSQWIRNNLPDSYTGFTAYDIDFVLQNFKERKVLILEVKSRGSVMRTGQKILYENLDKWIKNGIKDGWEYFGFFFVQFENTSFKDGKCFLNYEQVTEQELINALSFNSGHSKYHKKK
jgi:hypothetical protein